MKNWQLFTIMTGLLIINTTLLKGFHGSQVSEMVSLGAAVVFAFVAMRGYISDKNL